MPIDDRTTNRSYQLPNAGNQLVEDVARLRAALQAIDADIFARYTKTEVDTLISNLIQGAPGALDTLNELAAAMGDDPNFATTVTNQLALKANAADVYTKAQADARYVQGQVQTEMVFIATANQSVFTLTTPVINKPSALVSVDGVVQPTAEYSLNQTGTQLTLSEGVPAGTIVRVLVLGVASEGAPADDTVTTPKLRDGAVTTEKLASGIAPVVSSINGGQLAGMRNRIINGDMRIDQRNAGAEQSLSPGAKYTVDRWIVNTAGGTVTGQRITGASASQFRYRITGASGVTTIVFAQRIETLNSADLAGQTITISADMANSVLSNVSWSLQRADSDNNFSSVITLATGNWTVSSTISRYTAQVYVPASATTGLQLAFSVGSQTSGTWTIGDVQLEPGTVATPFERRSHGLELALCQRYCEVLGPVAVMFPWSNTTQIIRGQGQFAVTKRVAPTVTMGTKLNGVGTLSASSIDQYGCMFTGSGNASDVVTYTGNTASAEL